jgi:hypothetical protein
LAASVPPFKKSRRVDMQFSPHFVGLAICVAPAFYTAIN